MGLAETELADAPEGSAEYAELLGTHASLTAAKAFIEDQYTAVLDFYRQQD